MRTLAFIPLLLSLLLASCIEGEEEVWLERDGSGRLEATYKMPHVVMSQIGKPKDLVKTLKEASARDPHVELTDVTYQARGASVILKFSGTFDDLRKLATFPQRQLRDPNEPDKRVKEEALFGETRLDLSLRGISYERTVDLAWILPKRYQRAPGILEDSTFHYVLHLPVSASETNATNQSENGQKLEWSFLLKEYVNKPMHLHAKGPLPLPGALWLLALLPLLILVAIFIFRTRRSMRALEKTVE